LTEAVLQEKLDNIRGAVTMAYPMGLPEFDLAHALLHDPDDSVLASVAPAEYLDPGSSTLWCAGKEFHRDQSVGDRVGSNEKTKVVCRLQPKAGGPPVREPAVSEDERKAMMAW
jgi:cilia- and flagella-associated protein 298